MLGSVNRSDRFIKALHGYSSVTIVAHDNPDPDAIAAGWALQTLIANTDLLPTRLVGGGAIVRAENQHMVRLLKPPIELIDRLDVEANTAIILIDCQPESVNHLVDLEKHRIVAVIDHHERPRTGIRVPYRDQRLNVAATSTIASQYLREQSIQPNPALATALVYAIQTDTHSGHVSLSRTDRSMLSWLIPTADQQKLSEIAAAPLATSYFEDLLLAMENTFVYQDAGLCFLPTAHGPEIVGEVADLLIRCEKIERIMCAAVVNGDLLVSVRTTQAGGEASSLVRQALKGLGHGGGHRHRAGGKITGPVRSEQISSDLQSYLRARWLAACRIEQQRGSRLVPRQNIFEHL